MLMIFCVFLKLGIIFQKNTNDCNTTNSNPKQHSNNFKIPKHMQIEVDIQPGFPPPEPLGTIDEQIRPTALIRQKKMGKEMDKFPSLDTLRLSFSSNDPKCTDDSTSTTNTSTTNNCNNINNDNNDTTTVTESPESMTNLRVYYLPFVVFFRGRNFSIIQIRSLLSPKLIYIID